MLSYLEAEKFLLYILNEYIRCTEENRLILELIKDGSWKPAIYEIDKKKYKPLTTKDCKKLEDIFGLYC
ncbi:hypothetical protein [Streptococcus ruminantium]|uniref:hypothetical protein n=1 Tax=Streptococcus ruminantium TaxID=1917441 RepID=UPI0004645DF2|nr:hypothetical protein [Streptococcus ruminantium]MDQ8767809.1 hypothetical protein [Streptococcus ruminantium]MDQ8780886.1 hypothetical protein [Streptococcus ruminantium]BDD40609.1 hypothetical protein GUT184_08730 [Streptococcus ruminantium]